MNSERVVLDVSSDVTGTSRAVLAPPFQWTVALDDARASQTVASGGAR
jgi:hypothetical protein